MVVKSHLLYAFLKNQACFQTYPTISDFYRFCETGVKYGETGCETGVKLWFAISQQYMTFSLNFIKVV